MEPMKCDLNVQTVHSGACTVPVARRFCRESYADPQQVYRRLKSLGMDVVTATDHDSIDAGGVLATQPDFFLSEEVTVRLPSGAEAHIAVFDIGERQHSEIQRRRNDPPALLSFLHGERLLFSINHVFSGLTGRRDNSDFECFDRAFPCIETLNGAMVSRANELAGQFAALLRKPATGGSDAHTLASAGSAWTVVPGARSKQEFLERIRAGAAIPMGSSGSYARLTRDVVSVCAEMIRDQPWTVLLSPLVAGVPMVLLVHYWLEVAFAERCLARATGGRIAPTSTPSLEIGEVSL